MPSRESMIESLKDLLKTANDAEFQLCRDCGRPMEHCPTHFYFDDEVMEVPLPFCPHCTARL